MSVMKNISPLPKYQDYYNTGRPDQSREKKLVPIKSSALAGFQHNHMLQLNETRRRTQDCSEFNIDTL